MKGFFIHLSFSSPEVGQHQNLCEIMCLQKGPFYIPPSTKCIWCAFMHLRAQGWAGVIKESLHQSCVTEICCFLIVLLCTPEEVRVATFMNTTPHPTSNRFPQWRLSAMAIFFCVHSHGCPVIFVLYENHLVVKFWPLWHPGDKSKWLVIPWLYLWWGYEWNETSQSCS